MTHRTAVSPAQATLRAVAAGVAALAVAMGVGRFAFTPLLPLMQGALGFGNDMAGWLAASNHAGYLAGALAAAWLPARWPRRRLTWGGLFAVVLLTAAMAATANMAVWFALRFLTGVSSALVLVVATAQVLAALHANGRADLAGVHFGGVGLGIALSGALLAALGPGIDWRRAWLAVAALSLVLLLACRFLPATASAQPAGAAAAGAAGQRAHRLATWVLVAAYFLEGVGYIVTGTFLVAIARGEPALVPVAGWFWVAVGIAGAPSALMWTLARRPLGPWRALILAFAAQALGIVLPVLSPGLLPAPIAFVLSSILFGGTFMGITALILPLGASIAPMRPDRIMALLTASFSVGQIIGPVMAGQLSAGGQGFAPALVAAAALVALGALLLEAGRRIVAGSR